MLRPLPVALALIVAASCGSSGKSEPDRPDAEVPSPDAIPPLSPPRAVSEGRFSTSLVCATCHSNSPDADAMRDELDGEIAPYDLWQSTMMANSTRDPLWRAVVSAEVATIPSRKADIEATCMGCHAPMAASEATLNNEAPVTLELVYGDSNRSQLALDGVSCTGCHQITDQGLGTKASFSGNYVIGDDREIYGPHGDLFSMPMERHTGYRPTQSAHLSKSSMCASCHTLHTKALRPDGSETGDSLPEQTPYLEWRNSSFSTEAVSPSALAADCQDCHMPSRSVAGVPISTGIARNPGGFDFGPVGTRSPFSRHVFVGGNTLVPQLLRDNAAELAPLASARAFDATIALARQQLREHTATLAFEAPAVAAGVLRATIAVSNQAGHKFPTAHPSRRAWLHVTVRDGTGEIVFESGRHDAAGTLIDAAGSPLPSEEAGGPALSHLTTLDATSGPLVYETVMLDASGAITYRLLLGASYLKDNRLLPRGWRVSEETSDIKPVGVSDPTFSAGGDRVALVVDVANRTGPFTLEAQLLYQPLGARYAAELFALDTAEIRALRSMLDRADRRPELVASATIQTP